MHVILRVAVIPFLLSACGGETIQTPAEPDFSMTRNAVISEVLHCHASAYDPSSRRVGRIEDVVRQSEVQTLWDGTRVMYIYAELRFRDFFPDLAGTDDESGVLVAGSANLADNKLFYGGVTVNPLVGVDRDHDGRFDEWVGSELHEETDLVLSISPTVCGSWGRGRHSIGSVGLHCSLGE